MSEPFLAEVRMVGFTFAPRGWAFCDGQILPINQNQSLYSLLGTIYGGDGRTTFALPDLRGRTPIHSSDSHPLGQRGGVETHTLSKTEIPAHSHVFRVSTAPATERTPGGQVLAETLPNFPIYYKPNSSTTTLGSGTVANAGGGQTHENMQPYSTLNYCIAMQGLFPSRN